MLKLLWIGSVLLMASLVACGGDDDGAEAPAAADNGSSPAPADAASPQANDGGGAAAPGPSGSSSGTLTVDGKTFEFSVIFCGFTPEETRNANVPFSFRGTGTDDGRNFSVDGSITKISVGAIESTTQDLLVWYDDDAGNAIYSSGVPGVPAKPEFVINEKAVSFEAEFSDAVGTSVGTGTMQATCP